MASRISHYPRVVSLQLKIDAFDDHLFCAVTGSFTSEAGVRVLQRVLAACDQARLSRALVDVTGITEPALGTEKLLVA